MSLGDPKLGQLKFRTEVNSRTGALEAY